jgi:hypothetical protein
MRKLQRNLNDLLNKIYLEQAKEILNKYNIKVSNKL